MNIRALLILTQSHIFSTYEIGTNVQSQLLSTHNRIRVIWGRGGGILIRVTYFSFNLGLPLSSLVVSGYPFASRQKANRLTEKPSACRISCLTVDRSTSSSCGLVLMLSGHRLAWPAIGRSSDDSCWQWAAYATVKPLWHRSVSIALTQNTKSAPSMPKPDIDVPVPQSIPDALHVLQACVHKQGKKISPVSNVVHSACGGIDPVPNVPARYARGTW